jgi:hypothetical protein
MIYWIGGRLTRPDLLEDGAWKGKVSYTEVADHCKDSGGSCKVLKHCRKGSRKMIVAVEVSRLLPSGVAVDFSMRRILSTALLTWRNPLDLLEVDSMTLLSHCCHLKPTSEPPRTTTTDACPGTLSLRVYEHWDKGNSDNDCKQADESSLLADRDGSACVRARERQLDVRALPLRPLTNSGENCARAKGGDIAPLNNYMQLLDFHWVL